MQLEIKHETIFDGFQTVCCAGLDSLGLSSEGFLGA